MKNIIIVPAKGDSQRLPGKNWKKIGSKTLWELALIRAKKSELGRVVLATNDLKMIDIAIKNKLMDGFFEVSDNLANRRALDVCLSAFEECYDDFDNIIVTLPTSPLCTSEQMKEAYDEFLQNDRKTLASFIMINGRPNLWWYSHKPEHFSRIDVRTVWMDNGAIYMDRIDAFLKRKEWFDRDVVPYFMDEMTGIDIDTETDYVMAKTFYNEMKRKGAC